MRGIADVFAAAAAAAAVTVVVVPAAAAAAAAAALVLCARMHACTSGCTHSLRQCAPRLVLAALPGLCVRSHPRGGCARRALRSG